MAEFVTKIRTDDGDKQIDYNALANLPELNTMFSNPNLLINSDFRKPINQRGKTTYTVDSEEYTIDRWKMMSNASTLSVESGYIKFNSTVNPGFLIQKVDSIPVDDYITVSINVKSLTGVLNVYVAGTSKEECFSITSTGVTTYTTTVKFSDFMQLNIEARPEADVELYWAKVEQGSVATPFVPRLKAEELVLCQRYYEKRTVIFFPYGGVNPTTYYLAVNGSDHRVTKCRLPTITASALTDHNNVAVDVNFVSATQTKDNIRLMTVSAACDKYLLKSDIEFDAEIY